MATRGDISRNYLYILKPYKLRFKIVDKFCSKNPLVGAFSVVKVEIFGFLNFSGDINILCEIRFHFCAPGHSTVIYIYNYSIYKL